MGDTAIEWADRVWNPVVGCSRVSEGCRNCYAERVAHRGMADYHRGLTVIRGGRPGWTGEVRTLPHVLEKPLHWRKSRRVFVNSMSDLFHPSVPFAFIKAVFGVMASCPHHTFLVLTKRPASAYEVCGRLGDAAHRTGAVPWPLPNVWLGVSVEDQATADERIPQLLETPAALRWVSYEPALSAVDFRRWLHVRWQCSGCRRLYSGEYKSRCPDCGREEYWSGSHPFNGRHRPRRSAFPPQGGSALDWIVVGGESGPGARFFDWKWARSIVEQGRAAGVPVFVKQLGSNAGLSGGAATKGNDPSEWPEEIRVREFPEVAQRNRKEHSECINTP